MGRANTHRSNTVQTAGCFSTILSKKRIANTVRLIANAFLFTKALRDMHFSAEKERQLAGGRSAEGKSELERELALLQDENRALKEKLLNLNSDNAVQNSKIEKMEKQIERIMSILDKSG